MRRYLSPGVLSICCMVLIAASVRAQSQSGIGAKPIAIEILIIETDGARVNEISKMKSGRDEINRLIAEARARLVASLEVRTRTGENFTARAGQRVPIQTATLPALLPGGSTSNPREPQTIAVAVPKIEYENTGLVVEGMAMQAGDGFLDIRVKIELTGIDLSTGRLTPGFTQRTFTDVVRMKESETAMLIGLVQPRPPSLDQIASGTNNPAVSGMVVLLTTKPIQ